MIWCNITFRSIEKSTHSFDSVYCNSRSTAAVWNQTCKVSEVCLHNYLCAAHVQIRPCFPELLRSRPWKSTCGLRSWSRQDNKPVRYTEKVDTQKCVLPKGQREKQAANLQKRTSQPPRISKTTVQMIFGR